MEISFEANAIKELCELNNIEYKDEIINNSKMFLCLFLYLKKIKALLFKKDFIFVNFEESKPVCVECSNFENALCRIILLIWDELYTVEKEKFKEILQNENS